MKILLYLCLFVFLVTLSSCQDEDPVPSPPTEQALGEFLDENTYRVFPVDGDNFNVAEFRLWLPESEEDVRAILVLLGSQNFNGLGLVNSNGWQRFANKERLAMLTVHLKTINPQTASYTEAQLGSGQALLNALEQLSNASGNAYVKDLPFLFRGYSAGGLFSQSFSTFKPDRVLSFANIRGGSLTFTPDNNLLIPGMMIYGEDDFPQRNDRIIQVVELKRSAGGNWCLVKEPHTDHYGELEGPDNLIKLLFSKVLERRIDENGNMLPELQESDGWLGDQYTLEIYPFDEFPGNRLKASWLIDEEFALKWQEMQQ